MRAIREFQHTFTKRASFPRGRLDTRRAGRRKALPAKKNGHAVATLSRADRMVKSSRRWTNKVSERNSGERSSSEAEATRTSVREPLNMPKRHIQSQTSAPERA